MSRTLILRRAIDRAWSIVYSKKSAKEQNNYWVTYRPKTKSVDFRGMGDPPQFKARDVAIGETVLWRHVGPKMVEKSYRASWPLPAVCTYKHWHALLPITSDVDEHANSEQQQSDHNISSSGGAVSYDDHA